TVAKSNGNPREFKFALVFGLLCFSCYLVAATPYPALASTATIFLSPEEGQVGESVTVAGIGFAPFAEVSIEFEWDQVSTSPETIEADDEGEFLADFDIPDSTSAGEKTITATDDSANATSASSVLLVINSAPVASPETFSTTENSSEVITLQASDVNGDTLTYFIIDDPSHGAISAFDPDFGQVLYTPEPNYSGDDSFSFGANDGEQDSDAATISIHVGGADENNPPIAEDLSVEADEDVALEITLSASDIDGDALTFAIVGQPTHGTLEGNAPDLVYFPSANYAGNDNFTFSVNDGSEESALGSVNITIIAVNDPPVALSKSVSLDENSKTKITLSASDADGDLLNYTISSGPSQGTLTGNPPNIQYSPPNGYAGHDVFTFVATDGIAVSNVATVSITIVSNDDDEEEDDYEEDYYEDDYYDEEEYDDGYYGYENTAPFVNSQHVSGTEDTPLNLELSASDTEGDYLTFVIVDSPSHGHLSDFDDGLGTLTYTPSSEYSGSDSFTFKASDDYGESEPAT
ncbi:MAG: cadherin-like domain-containing protein, partial [Nitrososphaera sp.]|nr:cadherin-like domain-containing protein [Nitrososphaera sp.]